MYDTTMLSKSNDANATCPLSLLWSKSIIDSHQSALYVCIVATVTHSIFWLQLVFYPSVRKKAIQWLYAYMATDILLLFRFFFAFIVHVTSNECIPNRPWSLFICYFEAVFDNYSNALEVYILLALNICRHIQIVRNQNIYTTYVRSLICAHLAIYLIPWIGFIIQFFVGSTRLEQSVGKSCHVSHTNIYVQTINTVCAFALPIVLNIFVILYNMHHVHLISQLRRAQHHLSAREKYHRSLVIQFLLFYTVWLLLWSPNIIVGQLINDISNATIIASLLNYIRIALDPIIIAALDSRFQKLWRNLWTHLRNTMPCDQINQRRIVPIIADQNARLAQRAEHETNSSPT